MSQSSFHSGYNKALELPLYSALQGRRSRSLPSVSSLVVCQPCSCARSSRPTIWTLRFMTRFSNPVQTWIPTPHT